LEHTSPKLHGEQEPFLPFLINMPRLFESYVAKWLINNLPEEYHAEEQYVVEIDEKGKYEFRIDLLIKNLETGKAAAVLDTKYKRDLSYKDSDVYQVVAYATRTSSPKAFLIYPTNIIEDFRLSNWGDTDLEVIGGYYNLAEDLEIAGRSFVDFIVSNLD
jgi:5-methylcytosine-specific restriction enzyme subunit McrC